MLGQELRLFLVNNILASVEISSRRSHTLRTLSILITENHDEIQWNAKVSSDEILVVEDWILAGLDVDKDVKVLEDGDDDAEYQGEIRTIETEWGRVRHHVVVHSLGAPGAYEEDVRYQNGDPGQEAEDGNKIDKVGEDFLGVIGDVEEGDACDYGTESKRVNW